MFINQKEATVKVRMNPNCYIHITTEKDKEISCSGHFDVIEKDRKKERVWIGDEVWVSKDYAERLIQGDRSLARIIETRTQETTESSPKTTEKQEKMTYINTNIDVKNKEVLPTVKSEEVLPTN